MQLGKYRYMDGTGTVLVCWRPEAPFHNEKRSLGNGVRWNAWVGRQRWRARKVAKLIPEEVEVTGLARLTVADTGAGRYNYVFQGGFPPTFTPRGP